jgi:hypothetical protein
MNAFKKPIIKKFPLVSLRDRLSLPKLMRGEVRVKEIDTLDT